MPVSKADTKITIEAPDIRILSLTITGETPLLYNRWSQKAIEMIENKQQKTAASNKKREARDPEAEYRGSVYTDSEGYVSFPALALKQSIVGASRNIQGLTMTLLRGAVFVMGDIDGFIRVQTNGKDIKVSDEPLDKTGLPENEIGTMAVDAKNPNIRMRRDLVRLAGFGSPADIRYRMEITDWSMKLQVKYNASILSAEQVVNLIQYSGFACGLGEWRPERDGDHGTFTVATA